MAKRPNRERSIRRLTHDLRTVAFYCHRIPFLERESRRFSLDTLWKVKSAALHAVNRPLSLPRSRIIKSDRLSSCVSWYTISSVHWGLWRASRTSSDIETQSLLHWRGMHFMQPLFVFITTGNVDFLFTSG